ncbi:MAG: DMT family transporter [Alphaproteobacteria bacterium]
MSQIKNALTQTHTDKLMLAVFYSISAHFLFFIMSLSAKYLSLSHHPVEIVFYRNVIIFIAMSAFILFTGKRHLLHTKKPGLIAWRALIGTVSLITLYTALSLLPMAYATTIFFTSTLLTPILAFFFLKEHVGIYRWSAVIIGMLGVIIIAQPTGQASLIGLGFALATALLHGILFTVLRALKSEHPLTVTFYFVIAGSLLPGILFMPWIANPLMANELWIFLIVGSTGGFGQLALAGAYKYAPASFVTPIGYTALLWNILADIYYWKYEIDLSAICTGAGLILSAQLYMIYREYMRNNKRQSAAK